MIIKLPARRRGRRSVARLLAFITALAAIGPAITAEKTDAIDVAVADYFRPFFNDLATLAPDGEHVALSELGPKGAAIVVVKVSDRSSERYPVGRSEEYAVQQILWLSPTRLVFTTRSRAIGSLELGQPAVEAVLLSRDFDGYSPEPVLGPRTSQVLVTPDMPTDPSSRAFPDADPRREVSVTEALRLANVSGDLFGSESKRDAGSPLRPFLLGLKPGAANTVLVEVRSDANLYAYPKIERDRLVVPGNVYISEPNAPPPASMDDLRGVTRPGEYAAYDVDFTPPPLVVLELDVVKRRRRELAFEQNWRRVWLDHQGEPRIALAQERKGLRYLYRAARAKKWAPLETAVPGAAALGFRVTAENLLAARSVPLGFDAEGRILFFASNIGRDTYGLRALDLAQGPIDDFAVAHDRCDLIEPTSLAAADVLHFDATTRKLAGVHYSAARRFSRWFDPTLTQLQASLDKQFAPRHCAIRSWNPARTRFLVEVFSPADAGAFLVVDTAAGKLLRCGERAPWLTEERRNPAHEFDFLSDDGRRIAGYLTLPRTPRVKPAPVLVYFHDGPWFSDPPVFNRGAQALATLGFAVLQLNYSGSSGLGRAHLAAGARGLDRAVLEDVRAMLARIGAGKLPINTQLVATLGNGIGGYLAVRMTQLAPEVFRCAVAINAPGDFEAWRSTPDVQPTLLADQRRTFFGAERERLQAQSAVRAGQPKAPVLVVQAANNSYVPAALGRELFRAVKNGAEGTAFLELPGEGHGGWSEQTTARLFAELGRFFNSTIYNYGVGLRAPQALPDKP